MKGKPCLAWRKWSGDGGYIKPGLPGLAQVYGAHLQRRACGHWFIGIATCNADEYDEDPEAAAARVEATFVRMAEGDCCDCWEGRPVRHYWEDDA